MKCTDKLLSLIHNRTAITTLGAGREYSPLFDRELWIYNNNSASFETPRDAAVCTEQNLNN